MFCVLEVEGAELDEPVDVLHAQLHSWHKDDTYSAGDPNNVPCEELPVHILCKFLDYAGGVRPEGFLSLYFREALVAASMFKVKYLSSTSCSM
jgi:hypothetical protein